MVYDVHVFVCTNQRTGSEKLSCGEAHGLELVAEFKKQLKDRNIDFPVRAQRSGCLDACEHGPAMVVYPEGVFYGAVQESDISLIIDEHILNDRPVARLIIDFSKDKG